MTLASKKFSVANSHATAAVATQAAPGAGKRIFVTDIIASSDLSGAIIKLIEDTAGTPVTKIEVQQEAGSGNFNHHFSTLIEISENKSVSIEVNGTALCKANIVGYIANY